jgi:hypothetical protein
MGMNHSLCPDILCLVTLKTRTLAIALPLRKGRCQARKPVSGHFPG